MHIFKANKPETWGEQTTTVHLFIIRQLLYLVPLDISSICLNM